MALLGSPRIHIAFTDSRGNPLQPLINSANTTNEHFEVSPYKGATFMELVDIASAYLITHPFDVIYLVGGVNDITTKNHYTKLISYEWGTGPELTTHLASILDRADQHFHKYHPATKVVFCPLIGSDLTRVVNAHNVSEEDQKAVNDAVWEFNTKVFEINTTRNTFCPALQHVVHRFCKGVKRHYYHHLPDGIHLSEYISKKWALQFVKSMTHN